MKILILQHTKMENPGTLVDWVKDRGHQCAIHHIYENQKLPEQNQFDWLIALGGPMNIDEENKYPWLKAEKKFIYESLKNNKNYLGICLGGQLLAQVLGAKVSKNTHEEIGWHKVIRNQEQHHAFENWPKELHVFQWHEDRFDLPSGARALASSTATEFQAYGYGKNIVGLQFHPESTQNWILESYKSIKEEEYKDEPYVQNYQDVCQKTEQHLAEMTKQFFTMLDQMEKIAKG